MWTRLCLCGWVLFLRCYKGGDPVNSGKKFRVIIRYNFMEDRYVYVNADTGEQASNRAVILTRWPYCLKCGNDNPGSLTLDHIVPVSKGGKGHLDNLQTLCRKCNNRKGAKTVDYRPEDSR